MLQDDLLAQLEHTLDDVRLSDDERRNFTAALRASQPPEEALRQLRNHAFDLVRARVADLDPAALLRWLEGAVRAIDAARHTPVTHGRSAVWFSPGPACRAAIIDQLQSARSSVDICVFTLSDDPIANAVLAAHRRNVAVRFITDNDKLFDAGSDVAALRSAGVPTVVDTTRAHMHHKFAIFDGTRLLNGSYTWTRSASEHNEENLVLTHDPLCCGRLSASLIGCGGC